MVVDNSISIDIKTGNRNITHYYRIFNVNDNINYNDQLDYNHESSPSKFQNETLYTSHKINGDIVTRCGIINDYNNSLFSCSTSKKRLCLF